MRRELRTQVPSPGMRLYSALRRCERPLIRVLAQRVDVGGHMWHLLQHHLSRRSSLEPDWTTRSEFYIASLRAGEGLCVFPDCVFHYPQNISIGANVFMNRGVVITAPAPISIGNDVLIGPYAILNSGNHRYQLRSEKIRNQGHHLEPIVVGNDCWIGAGAILLPGVVMGDGSVVAAGAVVTRDIGPGVVVSGVPARPLRVRTD